MLLISPSFWPCKVCTKYSITVNKLVCLLLPKLNYLTDVLCWWATILQYYYYDMMPIILWSALQLKLYNSNAVDVDTPITLFTINKGWGLGRQREKYPCIIYEWDSNASILNKYIILSCQYVCFYNPSPLWYESNTVVTITIVIKSYNTLTKTQLVLVFLGVD